MVCQLVNVNFFQGCKKNSRCCKSSNPSLSIGATCGLFSMLKTSQLPWIIFSLIFNEPTRIVLIFSILLIADPGSFLTLSLLLL